MSISFSTLYSVSCQAPLSLWLSRQEYWSGLPLPSPGGLPDPGMEPRSPALAGGFFTPEPPALYQLYSNTIKITVFTLPIKKKWRLKIITNLLRVVEVVNSIVKKSLQDFRYFLGALLPYTFWCCFSKLNLKDILTK